MIHQTPTIQGSSHQERSVQTDTQPTQRATSAFDRSVQTDITFTSVRCQPSPPQPAGADAGAARALAEKMNMAIGSDDYFSGKHDPLLWGMKFSSREIKLFEDLFPLRRHASVREAMTPFVAERMAAGQSDRDIMEAFVAACKYAKIDVQHIRKIEDDFFRLREASEMAEASHVRAVEPARHETLQRTEDEARIRHLQTRLTQSQESAQSLQQKLKTATANLSIFVGKQQQLLCEMRERLSQGTQGEPLDEEQGGATALNVDPGGDALRQSRLQKRKESSAAETSPPSQRQRPNEGAELEPQPGEEAELEAQVEVEAEVEADAGPTQTPATTQGSSQQQPQVQVQTGPVKLSDYGKNPRVNAFIRKLTTDDLVSFIVIARTLMTETEEFQNEWEHLWKKLGFANDTLIAKSKAAHPSSPAAQMTLLCRLMFNKRTMITTKAEQDFLPVFESEHMAEGLRRAIYAVLQDKYAYFEDAYSQTDNGIAKSGRRIRLL
ncbi:MAG: hypothetical protein OXC07_12425 [Kistimonas sp.]|nr:hypothetical protein [Kistimonas sp.]